MKLFTLVLALALSCAVLAQEGGYTQVDSAAVANNREIQDLRDFGAQYVIDQGIQSGELPNGLYTVSETLAVYSQVVSGTNYKFDVELADEEGLTVRAEYVVYYQSWTNTTEVTSYSFEAINADGVTVAEEETVFANEEVAFEEESVFWNEEDLVQGQDSVVAGGFTEIDDSDVSDDAEVQELLNFGASYVIAQGIETHRLPNHNFTVSDVNSVFRQVVNGVNYKFDVELSDGQGFVARAEYVVYSQLWLGEKEVTSYSISVISASNQLPLVHDETDDQN